jgi:hypothetical protein
VDRLLRRLARTGARRALAGGHWGWLVLAAAAFVLRRARRAGEPVALSMPLRTGDRLLVTLTDPGAPPQADG